MVANVLVVIGPLLLGRERQEIVAHRALLPLDFDSAGPNVRFPRVVVERDVVEMILRRLVAEVGGEVREAHDAEVVVVIAAVRRFVLRSSGRVLVANEPVS
jgi:hypothetical protein